MGEPEILLHRKALNANVQFLLKTGGVPLFPVIKANAYGHGGILIAKYFESEFSRKNIPVLCVARLAEVRELRNVGIKMPLLVLSHHSIAEIRKHPHVLKNVELVVNNFSDVKDLLSLAQRHLVRLRGVHLNFNTGMNRLGFNFADISDLKLILRLVERLHKRKVQVVGLMTHLACAEKKPEQFSNQQVKKFKDIVNRLRAQWDITRMGAFPRWIHLENTAGLVKHLGKQIVTASRPGLGLWVGKEANSSGRVMTVRAPLRQIFWVNKGEGVGYGHLYRCRKKTLIGTVSMGYADGIDRRLSRKNGMRYNVGFIVEGTKVPVVGTVSMDVTMVDLTNHPKAKLWAKFIEANKPVSILAEWISDYQGASEIAAALNTIDYEIFCSLPYRLKRRFI